MKLERTIIELAEQKLIEYRGYVENPNSDAKQMSLDVSSAYLSLAQLVEISLVKNSGLSDEGLKIFHDIQTEMYSISHDFTHIIEKNNKDQGNMKLDVDLSLLEQPGKTIIALDDTSFYQGVDAFFSDLLQESNPYDIEKTHYIAWRAGWLEACEGLHNHRISVKTETKL